MECGSCGAKIEYNAGNQYMTLITREMVYGEFCVYPTEIGHLTVCSMKCLDEIISEDMRRSVP